MAILVVDDEAPLARYYARRLENSKNGLRTRVAFSAADAQRLMQAYSDWRGFLFDLTLGENARRAGFSLLALARTKFPLVPAGILTFHDDPRLALEASTLGGFLLSKQAVPDCLDAFAVHVVSLEARRAQNRPIEMDVDELDDDPAPESGQQPLDPIEIEDPAYGLTSAELNLVEAIMMGMEPKTYREVRRVTLATYKTQVSSILRKTDTKSLLALIARVRKKRDG
jgi:DNA-binding NarL/FixJ family response regulator